jgi:hypothetical protein
MLYLAQMWSDAMGTPQQDNKPRMLHTSDRILRSHVADPAGQEPKTPTRTEGKTTENKDDKREKKGFENVEFNQKSCTIEIDL